MGSKVTDFRDLEVYRKAFSAQQEVFSLTKTFPRDECYSLTDQVRRSTRSVGANISEAWRKRGYPAHFASKLSDADGETAETLHWLSTANACEYISRQQMTHLLGEYEAIGRMLGAMIRDAADWCI